jgi:ribosomal protein L37E
MKRSNHKGKRGDQPKIECRWCGHKSRSAYEAKNHVCRGS